MVAVKDEEQLIFLKVSFFWDLLGGFSVCGVLCLFADISARAVNIVSLVVVVPNRYFILCTLQSEKVHWDSLIGWLVLVLVLVLETLPNPKHSVLNALIPCLYNTVSLLTALYFYLFI